ncbi:MAG: hypothetical protein ABH875_03280, partial [Candidatus Omnitrophota bacterium]
MIKRERDEMRPALSKQSALCKAISCLLILCFSVNSLAYGFDSDTFDRIRAIEATSLKAKVERSVGTSTATTTTAVLKESTTDDVAANIEYFTDMFGSYENDGVLSEEGRILLEAVEALQGTTPHPDLRDELHSVIQYFRNIPDMDKDQILKEFPQRYFKRLDLPEGVGLIGAKLVDGCDNVCPFCPLLNAKKMHSMAYPLVVMLAKTGKLKWALETVRFEPLYYEDPSGALFYDVIKLDLDRPKREDPFKYNVMTHGPIEKHKALAARNIDRIISSKDPIRFTVSVSVGDLDYFTLRGKGQDSDDAIKEFYAERYKWLLERLQGEVVDIRFYSPPYYNAEKPDGDEHIARWSRISRDLSKMINEYLESKGYTLEPVRTDSNKINTDPNKVFIEYHDTRALSKRGFGYLPEDRRQYNVYWASTKPGFISNIQCVLYPDGEVRISFPPKYWPCSMIPPDVWESENGRIDQASLLGLPYYSNVLYAYMSRHHQGFNERWPTSDSFYKAKREEWPEIANVIESEDFPVPAATMLDREEIQELARTRGITPGYIELPLANAYASETTQEPAASTSTSGEGDPVSIAIAASFIATMLGFAWIVLGRSWMPKAMRGLVSYILLRVLFLILPETEIDPNMKYEYSLPMSALSDTAVEEDYDEPALIDRLEGRNAYWETLDEEGQSLMIERFKHVQEGVGFVRDLLADTYDVENISVGGGYVTRFFNRQIDFRAVVAGDSLERTYYKESDYREFWPFGTGIDEIVIEIIGQDRLESDGEEEGPYFHMLEEVRCFSYERNIVLWGRDFAPVAVDSEASNLYSVYHDLSVVRSRFVGLRRIPPGESWIGSISKMIARLHRSNMYLRYLDGDVDLDPDRYDSIYKKLAKGRVPVFGLWRLYRKALKDFGKVHKRITEERAFVETNLDWGIEVFDSYGNDGILNDEGAALLEKARELKQSGRWYGDYKELYPVFRYFSDMPNMTRERILAEFPQWCFRRDIRLPHHTEYLRVRLVGGRCPSSCRLCPVHGLGRTRPVAYPLLIMLAMEGQLTDALITTLFYEPLYYEDASGALYYDVLKLVEANPYIGYDYEVVTRGAIDVAEYQVRADRNIDKFDHLGTKALFTINVNVADVDYDRYFEDTEDEQEAVDYYARKYIDLLRRVKGHLIQVRFCYPPSDIGGDDEHFDRWARIVDGVKERLTDAAGIEGFNIVRGMLPLHENDLLLKDRRLHVLSEEGLAYVSPDNIPGVVKRAIMGNTFSNKIKYFIHPRGDMTINFPPSYERPSIIGRALKTSERDLLARHMRTHKNYIRAFEDYICDRCPGMIPQEVSGDPFNYLND